MFIIIIVQSLLSQDGSGADQFPLSKHIRSSAPTSTKPSSQEWVITESKVVLIPVVAPLSGMPGSPQLMTMKRFISTLHTLFTYLHVDKTHFHNLAKDLTILHCLNIFFEIHPLM